MEKSVADAIAEMNAPAKLPRRFYDAVSVADQGNGYVVELDKRILRTPGKKELLLPTKALAQKIADEWQAQSEQIDMSQMPLTRLANAAWDGVRPRMVEVCEDIVKYAGSDLLCYRADHPQELIALQEKSWDPILAWAKESYEISLEATSGIMPVAQSEDALAKLREVIVTRYKDAYQLAALHALTSLSGSAILSFAHGEGHLSVMQLWQAAHVDEDWQNSRWGIDDEAQTRRELREAELMAASTMLVLAREV